MDDAADLSHLADIVVPPPVPWWPPAPGWWILAVALLVAIVLLLVAAGERYRRNAYRRAALAELAAIAVVADAKDAAAVSSILKRTALTAFPRAEVASLSGPAWCAFLDRSGDTTDFTTGAAAALPRAAFGGSPGDGAAILAASKRWVNVHSAGGR